MRKWENETCQYCKYKIGYECKKLPPSIMTNEDISFGNMTKYPIVMKKTMINQDNKYKEKDIYQEACSYYEN